MSRFVFATLALFYLGCDRLSSREGRPGDSPDSAAFSASAEATDASRPSRLATTSSRSLTETVEKIPSTANDAARFVSSRRSRRLHQRDSKLLDPAGNGWELEAFAEAATQKLKQIDATVATDSSLEAALSAILSPEFRCSDLRPSDLSEQFRDARVVVHRANALPDNEDAKHQLPHQGVGGAMDAFRDMFGPFEAAETETHVKITQVSRTDFGIRTVCDIEFNGHSDVQAWQINAIWICTWQGDSDADSKLDSIHVTDYEEAVIGQSTTDEIHQWFTECTASVLGKDPAFGEQLLRGHHAWLQRIETLHRFDTSARNGLAIGDANGDGLDDVYLCQPPGLPNCLFLQNADGTATDAAKKMGVNWLDQTSAALFVDLDNDGDQDLVIGTTSGVLVMENTENSQYGLRQRLKLDYDAQSLSAVDYDGDGRLDIYVCVYRPEFRRGDVPFLYRDGRGGGMNRLYRSQVKDQRWSFEDVTSACGLADGAGRYSFAASWEDIDRDGDQDLYVANDFGRNYLYENRGGQFVDVAKEKGVLDIGSGMSVSWGDMNRDGLADLYVGNMFSSAGMRVTTNEQFRPTETSDVRRLYTRLAKGNSLFQHNGQTYDEIGGPAGVELGRWAWSSVFTDFNNDGWQDLFVANGYFTTDDSGDL